MQNSGRFWLAIILIAVGLVFLTGQLGILTPLGISVGWLFGLMWPLILVGVGINLLYKRNLVGGMILLLIGAVFFISNATSWNFWSSLWPLLIIAVGLIILLRPKEEERKEEISKGKKEKREAKPYSSEDSIDELVVFSGKEKSIRSQNFAGGKITSIFGGTTIDLRKSKIKKEGAMLDTVSIFGGVKIIVPENMRVESSGTPILGSWENKYKSPAPKGAPLLKITGSAIFGAVEVIN